MKHTITIVALLFITNLIKAQQTISDLNNGMLHNVFVFSENRNHTIMKIFGERINPMLVNVVYITTAETKKEIDEKIMSGEMSEGTFIFPATDATNTIRYCNAAEYAAALKRNEKPEIEKLQSTDK